MVPCGFIARSDSRLIRHVCSPITRQICKSKWMGSEGSGKAKDAGGLLTPHNFTLRIDHSHDGGSFDPVDLCLRFLLDSYPRFSKTFKKVGIIGAGLGRVLSRRSYFLSATPY